MMPQWKLASLLKAKKKHFSSGSWWILATLNMVYILSVLKNQICKISFGFNDLFIVPNTEERVVVTALSL